ncbi:MAG: EmrA/EmrK family multidrug efflux transporter periplasmic adaptor subunit [Caulobacteraceae bacterium]|nr:EmrA/EmrK family multidrug efflux transporter periplasmic adaptor subunit [Caulobacteraceae bacterium]
MSDTAAAAPAALDPIAAKRKSQRGRAFALLGGVVAVGAIVWGVYHFTIATKYVSTDNAYAGASSAQITPEIAGAITSVAVHETLPVKAGDVLFTIDPSDAKIALARAQAQYELAVSQYHGANAADNSAAAQLQARGADVNRSAAMVQTAQAELDRAQTDLQRRQSLAGTGAVSQDELTIAQNNVRTSQAALAQAQAAQAGASATQAAAKASLEQAQALTGGSSLAGSPAVAVAKAVLDGAQLDMQRTTVRAPIAGIVSENKAQVGQRVQAGAVMMTIAPVQDAFVDANFKEAQLRKVRIGQPVELESDLYGSKVVYHGKVTGIGGGTGAAFAAIPAQNATGNWIKVIQRVPVRITLDPKDLADHPLRVGLSMSAKIDISQ